MKSLTPAALPSLIGALLLGTSLAVSGATAVSGADRVLPEAGPTYPSTIKCGKSSPQYCFTVQNTGTGNGLEGRASSGYGLFGLSTSSSGVYGQSTSAFGVSGISSTSSGVAGFATVGDGVFGNSASGYGVYGDSSSGAGVYGQSSYSNGVYGNSSSAAGVYGSSSSNDGVYGQSAYGNGVHGYSQHGYGGDFESAASSGSGNGTVLYALGDAASDYLFVAHNQANDRGAFIDGDGNGIFGGFVRAYGGFQTVIGSHGGRGFGASVAITAQATMEDTGIGKLFNGEGVVRFDPAFASTIDASRSYEVFLTANGDTRGLYVSAKYERGFVVRENERGRSSVYFDYRIVAHPFGASDARLPRLNVQGPPQPPPTDRPRT